MILGQHGHQNIYLEQDEQDIYRLVIDVQGERVNTLRHLLSKFLSRVYKRY